jgi:ferric-dicitrate binding protein FerR (iron transport regulator)
MLTEHQEQLLLKLLNGKISPAEKEELNMWIQESEENKKLVEDFTFLWKESKPSASVLNFETDEEWTKLEDAMNVQKKPSAKEVSFSANSVWLKIAASITVICIFTGLLYMLVFTQENIIEESLAEIKMVTLPDGSKVWLNHDSRLAYQDDFNNEDRIVKLRGEAFFEVTKDASKPFVVKTSHAQVKVLGTSFNVQAFESTAETEVFVATGRVSFSSLKNRGSDLKLKPGETGVLNKKNSVVISGEAENLNALAWKEKRLVFRKSSLDDVLENVEQYFNVDIEVNNKNILPCRFTGSYDHPTLDDIIEALSVSLNLTISRQGDAYVLDGDGCQ